MKENESEFYNRLKKELEETTTWPSNYLYKFIVPNSPQNMEQIEHIFENTTAKIETKNSSSGKYVSYSIEINLENPDKVIEYYKKVSVIDGIISL